MNRLEGRNLKYKLNNTLKMKQLVTNVMQWLWNNQHLMMTPDELVELTDECITSCGGENGLLPHVSGSLPSDKQINDEMTKRGIYDSHERMIGRTMARWVLECVGGNER